jgi:hypothetical protein
VRDGPFKLNILDAKQVLLDAVKVGGVKILDAGVWELSMGNAGLII